LVTLKALTFAPTGGIVAAPTTSLPEKLGGIRNWDYRFCWLRDATLTLLALVRAGYEDEARAWRDWLLRAIAGGIPEGLQIMYGIAGERRLPELEVPWLDGYQESRPVRIGNAAAGQLQLDVYGEVSDALYQARAAGLEASEDAGVSSSRVSTARSPAGGASAKRSTTKCAARASTPSSVSSRSPTDRSGSMRAC
jgi:GH15 family glucan-1,4-alpha-glucosidase